MGDKIISLLSVIESYELLYYVFMALSSYAAVLAMYNFKMQWKLMELMKLMKVGDIVNPRLQELIESKEVKSPLYWLRGIFCCVLCICLAYEAMFFKQ